jgi:hypothetical protein
MRWDLPHLYHNIIIAVVIATIVNYGLRLWLLEKARKYFDSPTLNPLGSALLADKSSTALAQYAGKIQQDVSMTMTNTSVGQAQEDAMGPTISLS